MRSMTVGELKEILSKYNDEMEVKYLAGVCYESISVVGPYDDGGEVVLVLE